MTRTGAANDGALEELRGGTIKELLTGCVSYIEDLYARAKLHTVYRC